MAKTNFTDEMLEKIFGANRAVIWATAAELEKPFGTYCIERYLYNMTYKQIGLEHGMTIDMASNAVRKATSKMKIRLRANEIAERHKRAEK